MSNANQAVNDFADILRSLDRKFEIIHCKWTDDKLFEIRLRTGIDHSSDDYNTLCDEWVNLFSNVTNTIWVNKISNTGPKIRFRKQYQCWTQGPGKIKKELLFDSRKCSGVLDMKVLTDTPLTRKKNKHIKMGLNAVVKINFNHLHPVATDEAFSFFVHNCSPQAETLTRNVCLETKPEDTSDINNHCISHLTHANQIIASSDVATIVNDNLSQQHATLVPLTVAQHVNITESLNLCAPTSLIFDPGLTTNIQVSTQVVSVQQIEHINMHEYHLQ